MAQRTESRDVSGENTADAIDPDDEAGKKRGQSGIVISVGETNGHCPQFSHRVEVRMPNVSEGEL